MDKDKILDDVAKYYTEKLQTFGVTAKGVDWNSTESQEVRFIQLLKVIENSEQNFSLLDYGCGFGAMFSFLKNIFGDGFLYKGYDISIDMINKAKELYKVEKQASWINRLDTGYKSDYVVASGIFNVRLQHDEQEWENYIFETLQEFDNLSIKGFAFNMLTSYSDTEYMREHLYYANPGRFFDYCKKRFSKYVGLLHDYPLYEFTIIVKKS